MELAARRRYVAKKTKQKDLSLARAREISENRFDLTRLAFTMLYFMSLALIAATLKDINLSF
jgi:hypothetical protein